MTLSQVWIQNLIQRVHEDHLAKYCCEQVAYPGNTILLIFTPLFQQSLQKNQEAKFMKLFLWIGNEIKLLLI